MADSCANNCRSKTGKIKPVYKDGLCYSCYQKKVAAAEARATKREMVKRHPEIERLGKDAESKLGFSPYWQSQNAQMVMAGGAMPAPYWAKVMGIPEKDLAETILKMENITERSLYGSGTMMDHTWHHFSIPGVPGVDEVYVFSPSEVEAAAKIYWAEKNITPDLGAIVQRQKEAKIAFEKFFIEKNQSNLLESVKTKMIANAARDDLIAFSGKIPALAIKAEKPMAAAVASALKPGGLGGGGGMMMEEKAILEFRKIFANAQKEIRDILANYKIWNIPGYELGRVQVIQKQVAEVLAATNAEAAKWASQWLPNSYSNGSLYATRDLAKLGLATQSDVKAGFAVVDIEAIKALAQFTAQELNAAAADSLKKIGSMIRHSQLPTEIEVSSTQTLAKGLILGKGIPQMKADLLEKALNGQFAPGGYKGSLADYAELLARTRTREAQMAGALSRYDQYGVDLVIVPAHSGACPLCAPWQGAVFSISGSHPKYPPLDLVGNPPWHPNCEDVIAPYVEELRSDEENAATLRTTEAALMQVAA